LRPKLTRRERLRLPQQLRFKKTPYQKRMIKKYPQRKFAVVALSRHLPTEIQKINLKAALAGKKPGSAFYKYYRMSRKQLRNDRKLKSKKNQKRKLRQKEKGGKPQEKPVESAPKVAENPEEKKEKPEEKTEVAKVEVPVEVQKPVEEAPKTEAPKTEEVPKTEVPKTEVSEAPKTDAKTEVAKTEVSEAPKGDSEEQKKPEKISEDATPVAENPGSEIPTGDQIGAPKRSENHPETASGAEAAVVPLEVKKERSPQEMLVKYDFEEMVLFETASVVVPKNKAECATALELLQKKQEYYRNMREQKK